MKTFYLVTLLALTATLGLSSGSEKSDDTKLTQTQITTLMTPTPTPKMPVRTTTGFQVKNGAKLYSPVS